MNYVTERDIFIMTGLFTRPSVRHTQDYLDHTSTALAARGAKVDAWMFLGELKCITCMTDGTVQSNWSWLKYTIGYLGLNGKVKASPACGEFFCLLIIFANRIEPRSDADKVFVTDVIHDIFGFF